jgi:hypothetical protein
MNYQMRSSQVTFERIDGELILISMDSGKYYSATGTAADIFYLIENKTPLNKFSEVLAKHFTEFDDSEILGFVEKIHSENLIEPCLEPNIDHVDLPADFQREIWVSPIIMEFSDLQVLILVDPVHDASLSGWPVEKS